MYERARGKRKRGEKSNSCITLESSLCCAHASTIATCRRNILIDCFCYLGKWPDELMAQFRKQDRMPMYPGMILSEAMNDREIVAPPEINTTKLSFTMFLNDDEKGQRR